MADGLRLEVEGALARVTLDRPMARNAITRTMRQALAGAMPDWARNPQVYALTIGSAVSGVFAAGGDIREITALARLDYAAACASFAGEVELCWLLECFSKPTVSLIDGVVMGTGVGITNYGTHRVAGERYRFAMPETAIGFFPDCGMAHALARLPDHVGMYLGLTGRQIGRADAFQLGLATHCIPHSRFAGIETALRDAEPVDPLLEALQEDPGPAELAPWRALIARCFDAPDLGEIHRRLAAESGEDREFARAALADLEAAAPLALAVTHRHITEAAGRDLRQTLTIDYRLGCRFLAAGDVHEGVRAMLVDKDRSPRWQPPRSADVTAAMVERCFAPMPGAELVLPTRQEMQAARV